MPPTMPRTPTASPAVAGTGAIVSGRTGIGDGIAAGRRSSVGQRILEVTDRQHRDRLADPGPRADQTRLEDAGVTATASDDDVVRAGRAGQLVDDGRDDGIGRDRVATGSRGSARTTPPLPGDRPRGRRRLRGVRSPRCPRRATSPPMRRSIGPALPASSWRMTRATSATKVPANAHHARRMRRSDGPGVRVGSVGVACTSERQDGGRRTPRPVGTVPGWDGTFVLSGRQATSVRGGASASARRPRHRPYGVRPFVDRGTARDYTPAAPRATRPRPSHSAPRLLHPVDDGPSPAGAQRAASTSEPVRPAS